jgi:hypothetical protein
MVCQKQITVSITGEGNMLKEQPKPTENEKSGVVILKVMEDLENQAIKGLQHYGTVLKTHNGRDALQDAYEEALDLAMYLAQAIMERDDNIGAKNA